MEWIIPVLSRYVYKHVLEYRQSLNIFRNFKYLLKNQENVVGIEIPGSLVMDILISNNKENNIESHSSHLIVSEILNI